MGTNDTSPFLDPADLMTRDEAVEALGVRASTLYTYVSRKLVRSFSQPGTKAKLFHRGDVEALKRRSLAHSGTIARAETTMAWGAPIMLTSITEITREGPVYRGLTMQDAANRDMTFEAIATHLWSGHSQSSHQLWQFQPPPESVLRLIEHFAGLFDEIDAIKLFGTAICALGQARDGRYEVGRGTTLHDAQAVITLLVGCCGYLGERRAYLAPEDGWSIAEYMVAAVGIDRAPANISLLNRAMVLCAEFELSTSTFAARVAASARCDLFDCLLAGVSTHGGALVARSCLQIEEFLARTVQMAPEDRVTELLRQGKEQFGFNHPLFEQGDPRALELLARVRALPDLPHGAAEALEFSDLARRHGAHPGVGLALVVVARALGMAPMLALAIWTISRTVGHVANIAEQRMQNHQMRPRAKASSMQSVFPQT